MSLSARLLHYHLELSLGRKPVWSVSFSSYIHSCPPDLIRLWLGDGHSMRATGTR